MPRSEMFWPAPAIVAELQAGHQLLHDPGRRRCSAAAARPPRTTSTVCGTFCDRLAPPLGRHHDLFERGRWRGFARGGRTRQIGQQERRPAISRRCRRRLHLIHPLHPLYGLQCLAQARRHRETAWQRNLHLLPLQHRQQADTPPPRFPRAPAACEYAAPPRSASARYACRRQHPVRRVPGSSPRWR